ncbi:hypothetical protein AX16_001440 [Volvariella volvacea WC 439]|nr:hypothetical protein AX16_001440 [Volvariella volvacea WC 439]
MDDPWANAWGDPTKSYPAADPIPSSISNFSAWPKPSPSISSTEDHEADLAQPSWSTGAGVSWADQSDSHLSLWGSSTLPTAGWAVSSYETIPIGRVSSSQSEHGLPLPPASSSTGQITGSPTSVSSPSPPPSPSLPPDPPVAAPTPPVDHGVSPPTIPATPLMSSFPVPDSPDAFGTFEVAAQDDESRHEPWTPSQGLNADEFASSGAWGASWGSDSTKAQADQDDEWTAAKRLKEKQDRHVPPEVLSTLLDGSRALCEELWPEISPSAKVITPKRYEEMDDIAELTTIRARIVPDDLNLPPAVQFSKTFASKRMTETLKLTRHVPLTRGSPMAMYLASKGSMAWEISVKSRPEISLDADLPPGWRILEKEKQDPVPVTDSKKRASSGILSFFGRKAASPVAETQTQLERSVSPAPSISKQPSIESPRLSIDKPSPAIKLPSPVTIDTPPATQNHVVPPTSSPTSPLPASHPEPMPEVVAPQQSAVSRFLNRFSRAKVPSPSARSSLALSSDDLEFLSDIVPSASDDVEADDSAQLKALTSMIQSSPLPTKLPPPLAPPPKLTIPAPPKKTQSPLSAQPPQPTSFVRPEDKTYRPEQNQVPRASNDDFFDLFGNGTSVATPSTQPAPTPQPVAGNPYTAFAPIHPTQLSLSPNSTRSNTPVDKSLPPIASQPRSQTPAIPPKRTITAVMSTTLVAEPSAIPKLEGFFGIAPPPSSTSARSTPVPAIVAPQGISSFETIANVQPASVSTSNNLFDDDDFSEFHSGPTMSTSSTALSSHLSTSSTLSASISTGSEQGLVAQSSFPNTMDASAVFDDFDDFVSSPIRSPSPPRPPSKSPIKPPIKAPQPIQPIRLSLARGSANHNGTVSRTATPPHPVQVQQTTPKRKTSADHSRTLSLLEAAASRKGRWPAPPSPLPEALPPPTDSRTSVDLLDGIGDETTTLPSGRPSPGRSMSDQQAAAMADLGTLAPSAPKSLNPPGRAQTPNAAILSLFNTPTQATRSNGFGAASPVLSLTPQSTGNHSLVHSRNSAYSSSFSSTTSTSNTTGGSGGLSAQDLSFFETL